MDIQISSNFERLLFELFERDGAKVAETLERFRASGSVALGEAAWRRAREVFDAHRLDDTETLAEMARLHRETGELVDPHSAIGVAAARAKGGVGSGAQDVPVIVLATAHPAKFPDAVEKACGVRPVLPPRLADLFEREERCAVVDKNLAAVQAHVRRHARPAISPAATPATTVPVATA